MNLCTIGNTVAVDDLWMLEEYIGRFGLPRRVLLIHVYDVRHRSFQQVLLARIPRAGLAWAQAEVPLTGSGLGRFLLAKYLRLFAENRRLRDLLLPPWKRPNRQCHIDGQGFMASSTADAQRVRRDVASHLRFVGEHRFEMSEQNRTALERLGALADHHGFDLFVVNSPVNERLAANPGFWRYFAQMQRALGQIAARHAHMRIVSRTYPFPEDQMENAYHITGAATAAYAGAVAQEIAATRTRTDRSGQPGGAQQQGETEGGRDAILDPTEPSGQATP